MTNPNPYGWRFENSGSYPGKYQDVAKAAAKAAVTKAAAEKAAKIDTLTKAAADWRQRALDGRVSGLDPEVRSLYVAKAEAAEAEADRLRSGQYTRPENEAKAQQHDAEASIWDRKATDTTDSDLRSYYREKARECRTKAAILRGQRVNPDDGDGHRSVSFNLPR